MRQSSTYRRLTGWFTIPALALVGWTGCEEKTRPSAAQTGIIQLATVLPEDHPTAEAMKFFKKRLEDLSKGALKVELSFDSEAGGANMLLQMCQDGKPEMAQVSTANITNMCYMANVLAMPFLWQNAAHQYAVLDGEVGERIRREVAAYDLSILGFMDAGTRSLTTMKGPINKPEDLAGMRIRVMNAPLMVETIEALGALAVPMEQSEVREALTSGKIDGWENNPMTIMAFKMYETGCNHFAWTRHLSIPDVLVASQTFLQQITPQQRGWVEQAARETIARQREIWADAEKQAIERMQQAGMTLTDVDSNAFRARVAPLYERYFDRHGEEFQRLVEQIRNHAVAATSTAPQS